MAIQVRIKSIFHYYIHMSCVLHIFLEMHELENGLVTQFEVFSPVAS